HRTLERPALRNVHPFGAYRPPGRISPVPLGNGRIGRADGTAISRLTLDGLATILLLGLPVVFLAAAQAPAAPKSPATPTALQLEVNRAQAEVNRQQSLVHEGSGDQD